MEFLNGSYISAYIGDTFQLEVIKLKSEVLKLKVVYYYTCTSLPISISQCAVGKFTQCSSFICK